MTYSFVKLADPSGIVFVWSTIEATHTSDHRDARTHSYDSDRRKANRCIHLKGYVLCAADRQYDYNRVP